MQLTIYYFYYSTINCINTWHLAVKGSGLPFETILQKLIRDRLKQPVESFIKLTNSAVREHCIKSIDFSILLKNDIWDLQAEDILKYDSSIRVRRGRHNRLIGLVNAFDELWPSFTEAIKLLATVAEDSIEESLFKQKEELKQQHTPHLALLFAFLKLFQHLQSDLNTFSRNHLDFFFKEVLRIQPRPAEADKAHIVFEIQKQLNDHLLKKGLLVKDGKDKNNAEILFSLDDEIVVNKAQVEEVRTLFLNRNVGGNNTGNRFLEGVYIAPKADKADGLKKDFKETDPKNWSTIGAKYSKFIDVGNTNAEPQPYARIGFILASPVLLMSGGNRTVTVSLLCEINKSCSTEDPLVKTPAFFNALKNFIKTTYIIVSKALIFEARAKGISNGTLEKLGMLLPILRINDCCPPTETEMKSPKEINKVLANRADSSQLTKNQWVSFLNNATPLDPSDDIDSNEQLILNKIFIEHSAFTVLLSGKEAWIKPSSIMKMRLSQISVNIFKINIKVRLNEDLPAVEYYDNVKLKEDFNTKLPLIKIELNQVLKMHFTPTEIPSDEDCCFKICKKNQPIIVSPYTFLRNLSIIHFIPATPIVHRTIIHVKVCSLKTFVVQNDENVGDVNSIILPFGSIPKEADNFYIGSKEVFCKNWVKMMLRFFWKDLPERLENYYHGYEDIFTGIDNNYFLNDKFMYSAELLDNGVWVERATLKKKLFASDMGRICNFLLSGEQQFYFNRNEFLTTYTPRNLSAFQPENHSNTSRDGFLKLTLRDRDFQHDRYSFVLARQMMALGKFPKEIYIGPVYDGFPALPTPLPSSIQTLSMDELFTAIQQAYAFTQNLNPRAADIISDIKASFTSIPPFNVSIDVQGNRNALGDPPQDHSNPDTPVPDPPYAGALPNFNEFRLDFLITALDEELLKPVNDKIINMTNKLVVIPNPPYTPQIQGIAIDYTAIAKLEDIDFIHLYPYEQTHKPEEIELKPALLPTFCDEGTLFIGFKQLVPGTNVNVLFQLAETTADSEAEPAKIIWHYLVNNQWKELRKGFEVLEDETNGLTTSGIFKLAIPGDISIANTILPKELHWIKASAVKNVEAVSETIGIHTQAMRATFINTTAHDQLRLDAPLEQNKLSKLQEADASVKKLAQPYESFGGRVPEANGYYYIRASELLRHKDRGIQKFDYERLVLDAFPQIYKVKCINHNFALNAKLYRHDVNAAPGYVIVAVIPDLNKLKAGQSFEPKAPVSLLEKITDFLRKRTSPFARIKVMNPRYETIDLCLTVQLVKGKDKVYYKSQLEKDLRVFLAPWAVGEFDKLNFGQCVNRSDIVRFIEGREYVDYIICLRMMFEVNCEDGNADEINEVCPLTPRSILVGGNIDVCIPEKDDCETWDKAGSECSKKFNVTVVECKNIGEPTG